MKRFSLNARVFAVLGLVFAALVITSVMTTPKPNYAAFMQRDQRYFAQIAAACDTFLSKNPSGEWIPSDNGENFLPPILGELPTHLIKVSSELSGGTNSVSRLVLTVGMRRGKLAKDGYEIIWENSREDFSLWNLSTHTRGLPDKIVFSLRKTPSSNGEKSTQ